MQVTVIISKPRFCLDSHILTYTLAYNSIKSKASTNLKWRSDRFPNYQNICEAKPSENFKRLSQYSTILMQTGLLSTCVDTCTKSTGAAAKRTPRSCAKTVMDVANLRLQHPITSMRSPTGVPKLQNRAARKKSPSGGLKKTRQEWKAQQ